MKLSKILENRLNSAGEKLYEVMNLGVVGHNSLDEVRFFKEVGSKYKPDIVIIGFLSNDILDNTEIDDQTTSNEHQVSENYYWKMDELIKTQQDAIDKMLTRFSNNETMFNYYWRKIIEQPLSDLAISSKKENFTVIIAVLCCSEYGPIQKEIEHLQAITKKYGWYFVDINQVLSKYDFNKLTVGKRDSHYNYFTNKLIPSKLYEFMLSNNLMN